MEGYDTFYFTPFYFNKNIKLANRLLSAIKIEYNMDK